MTLNMPALVPSEDEIRRVISRLAAVFEKAGFKIDGDKAQTQPERPAVQGIDLRDLAVAGLIVRLNDEAVFEGRSVPIRLHVCGVARVTYLRGDIIVNRPVNMALVTKIEKTQTRWYPDNTGKPALSFFGVDETWTFDTVAERDAEYDRVIEKFA